MLGWALERFSPSIAISTAFQIDGVALIDMAYEIDPRFACSASTPAGCPQRRYELIERLRDRYPGPAARPALAGRATRSRAWTAKHGPNLFYAKVDQRLLCCQHPQGAAADAAPRLPRRVDHRASPRPVGEPHEHPQGRDRPRPRRDPEAEPARRMDRGRGLGLRARARRPVSRAVRPRLHIDRLRALHARDRAGRGEPRRAAGGGRRTRRRSAGSTAPSRAAGSSTSCTR